jgi:hypothetical protein
MEDEGTLADHLSGVSATDGQWHHIAVTWESRTGTAILYMDSREVWRVIRGKGKKIPSGGTLVIGREQVRVDGGQHRLAGRGSPSVAVGLVSALWEEVGVLASVEYSGGL